MTAFAAGDPGVLEGALEEPSSPDDDEPSDELEDEAPLEEPDADEVPIEEPDEDEAPEDPLADPPDVDPRPPGDGLEPEPPETDPDDPLAPEAGLCESPPTLPPEFDEPQAATATANPTAAARPRERTMMVRSGGRLRLPSKNVGVLAPLRPRAAAQGVSMPQSFRARSTCADCG